MGVFTSALDGAIEGARDRVIRDALNRKQNEIDELQEYNNLLSFGAKLYRAIAEGQIISAAKHYGNYYAAREIMKEFCNFYPEENKKFIPLKRKFVEEYVNEKYNTIKQRLAEHGQKKAYATVEEIQQNKMNFVTPEEIIAEAMDEPSKNPAPNYVTSPFGSPAPQEEKKKDKGSWFFGKK